MAGIVTEKPTVEKIQAFRKAAEEPLKELKDAVDARDVERFKTEDDYASLFLEWTRSDDAALKLVLNCLKWRNENKVNDMTAENMDEVLKLGNMFLLGKSIRGSRVLYLRGEKLQKKDRENTFKMIIFWLERIQRREPGKRLTFVLDTTNTSLSQNDMGLVKFVIECFTTYFPCMLDCMIVYNLPTLLNSIWGLISKLLSEEQRQATVLCSKDQIFKYIDPEFIPTRLGGKNAFEYSYPPFPDDLEA